MEWTEPEPRDQDDVGSPTATGLGGLAWLMMALIVAIAVALVFEL
jgi:hypothetical protein